MKAACKVTIYPVPPSEPYFWRAECDCGIPSQTSRSGPTVARQLLDVAHITRHVNRPKAVAS